MPASRAAAQIATASFCGKTTPPPRFCVFSIATSPVGGSTICPRGFTAARNSATVKMPAGADGGELHPGIGRRGAGFVPHHVRVLADDHIVAGPGQQLDGDLVGHRAARHEQRRFLAEQRGDPLLQEVDRRVLAVLVVADRRFGHGPAHLRRRPGDGVRTQVDGGRGLRHGLIRCFRARGRAPSVD